MSTSCCKKCFEVLPGICSYCEGGTYVEPAAGPVGGAGHELAGQEVLAAGHQALQVGRVGQPLHVHQEGRRHQVRRQLRLLVQRGPQRVAHYNIIVRLNSIVSETRLVLASEVA